MNTVGRDHELYAFRRHLKNCAYFGPGGRSVRLDKCNCPFHVDGNHWGERVRQSLETRSHQLADRRLRDLIQTLDAKRGGQDKCIGTVPTAAHRPQRTVSEAIERFLGSYGEVDSDGTFRGDSEYSTFRKYRNIMRCFEAYCKERGIVELTGNIEIDELEGYRRTRVINAVTWKSERQALITFFGFCLKRKWILTNPPKS